MNSLKGKKVYIILLLIGVLLIGYPLYKGQVEGENKPVLASAEVETELDNLFPSPNKTSYQMGLYLDINHRIIYGSTIINTENTSKKDLEELWFTAYPNAFKNPNKTPAPKTAYYAGFDDGWLEFSEIKVNGQEVSYNIDGVSVQVLLNKKLLTNEPLVVEMKWIAKVPKVAYRYGTQNNVFMLGNFYPTLNVLGEEWHNSYNSLFGDPFCFHTANYVVRLNTPEVYDVVATGDILQKLAEDNGRVTHIIEANKVRDFALAILYNYEEISRDSNKSQVKLYAPLNNIEKSTTILHKAIDILNYYSYKFGSYPYKDFKVVFVPMQGFHGMEYSGLIFLRDEFLQPNYNDSRSEFILAHEIAHQWWYGMVGNDQLKEPWLDEGLANWSAYKYLQDVKGQKIATFDKYKKEVNLAKELSDIYSTPEYYRTAYTGGEAFWFNLENELGTETVFKILRNYLAEYKYKIATTEDLFNIIKKEADKDMDEYLLKWFNP